MTREDIELSFIREFSVHGVILANLSRHELYERVRVAIHQKHAAATRFYDVDMTYADAYRVWTGKALELRQKIRQGDETDLEQSLTRKIEKLSDDPLKELDGIISDDDEDSEDSNPKPGR